MHLVIDEETGILLAKRSGPARVDTVLSDIRIDQPVDGSLVRFEPASPGDVIRIGPDQAVQLPAGQGRPHVGRCATGAGDDAAAAATATPGTNPGTAWRPEASPRS